MKTQAYPNTKRVGFFNEAINYGDPRVAVIYLAELIPSKARDLIT